VGDAGGELKGAGWKCNPADAGRRRPIMPQVRGGIANVRSILIGDKYAAMVLEDAMAAQYEPPKSARTGGNGS
jgi:hypothetical protein